VRIENDLYTAWITARNERNEPWPEPETEKLYHQLVVSARRIITHPLGTLPPGLASDAAAAALLKAPSMFEGRSQFSTWFYRLVFNEVQKHLKFKARRREIPLEVLPETPAPLREPTVLAKLPEHDLELLRLIEAGYKQAEIGEILGLSEEGVRKRWQKLRKRLQAKVKSPARS
jgi:DNA-directed RNA polymerase specialized sigma24 family protein